MKTPGTHKRRRYSKNSKKLWEEGPSCSPEKYYISYSRNGKEPVLDPKNEPYRVFPIIKPKVNGYFAAFPGGLNIDPYTGEIDVNASDTGIRYTVEFTPCGESCVTSTTVVIGGISYLGGIFSLSSSPPRDKSGNGYIAEPFYNGQIQEEVPRDRFRIVNSKELEVAKIMIDPVTGWVDLKESIKKGALGFRRNANGGCDSLPENGTSKEFNIEYEWYDTKNQKAPVLTQTNLRLHFYNSREDIPEDLRIRVEQQNNSILSLNSITLPLFLGSTFSVIPDSPWFQTGSIIAALTSWLLLLNSSSAQGSNNPYKPPERIATAL